MAISKVEKVRKHINAGIQDDGCYTSRDFKSLAREFKSMVIEQLKKVGGTNYQQNVGHYYLSGFFTIDKQVYYISFNIERGGFVPRNDKKYRVLIRTAENYRDFTGGCNHFIQIQEDMFKEHTNKFRGCLPIW